MPVVITGWRSAIAEAFRALLPETETPLWGKPLEPDFPTGHERYLFCHGLLRPKRMEDQSQTEREEGWAVNAGSVIWQCEEILRANAGARICIIGSESGYRGSFDEVYACAKRAVHSYVETRRLNHPGQQLVAISPGIVEDCGMTLRRRDVRNLTRRRLEQPKRRFLRAAEVAEMACELLYWQDYVTGTVIRMHGGER